jgi:two-component system OmpR family response regulator
MSKPSAADAAPSLRILVIEDDLRMVDVLRRGLWDRGHSVTTATTAGEGQQLASEHAFDAVVLDVGLPDGSGFIVAEQLRKSAHRPAVVMLTAFGEEDHIVAGLESGADDYLTKPFSFSELNARITAAHRRATLFHEGVVHFGGFTLNLREHRLLLGPAELRLPRQEHLLLHTLALHQGEAVPRRKLMQAVWASTSTSHGALDTLVATLRDRLTHALAAERGEAAPELIVTLRGVGYMLLRDAAGAGS